MVHKDFIPLAYTATIFQAEILAIKHAISFIINRQKTLKPKYIKLFSDSRAALQALNSYTVKSSLVQDTIDQLNRLSNLTERITLNWIKAHNDHRGNEYADIMANTAANCTQEHIHVPIAYNLFKAHIKTAIYAEWIHLWQTDDNKYKHTKIFFPRMEPKYSKQILKLSRPDLKLLIEIITGHNNLKSFSTKIKALADTQCRYCHKYPETVMHLLTTCSHFNTERLQLKLNRFDPQQSTTHSLTWSIPLTLEFFKQPALHKIITNLFQ